MPYGSEGSKNTVVKILMLGWELPPNNSGGLGVACLQMCKALAQRGADIEFVLPFHSDPTSSFMKVTSTVSLDRNSHSMSSSSIQLFGAYDSYKYQLDGNTVSLSLSKVQDDYESAVASLADEREFEVIHAHDWLTFRAAMRAKEISRRPLIAHVHSIERDRAGGNDGNPIVREIEYLGLHMADKVIAVSDRVRQMIAEDYFVPLDKIDVVHNSINLDDIDIRNDINSYKYLEYMKSQGWNVVVNIGRLTIQKGLSGLIDAAADVIKKEPKTFFLFVGSGEQRDELLMQAARLGIADKVIFTGFLRGKTWRDAYKVADLFVMPSVSEPFGLTPLEAMGYGAPVLISRQSGVSEVLRTCLKVDFWDTTEMANKIVGVLQNNSLKNSLQDNGYRELSTFTWDNSARKIIGLYHDHLSGVPA